MQWRTPIATLVLSTVCVFAALAAPAEKGGECTDRFSLDGAQNILDEAHFGIVNGKLTVGVPYRNAFAVDGLWAPPYVSSDFSLKIALMEQPVATQHYTWHPFHVDRSGSIQGITIQTTTTLIPGTRAGLVEVTLTNVKEEQCTLPVTITAGGTLDRSEWWEFSAPKSKTATARQIVNGSLCLSQGVQSVVLRANQNICWTDSQPCAQGSISLAPAGSARLCVVFAIGPSAEAAAQCERIAACPERAMADAQAAYAARVQDLFQKLPEFRSSNPALERLYSRSLVHLIMNRWDVPEFVLHPYYSTGSVRGGCVCDYLWNFGENWEILPLYDPEAAKAHIKKFLSLDMTKHFALEPVTGRAVGPWYMVNQEKIIGLIHYYVKNTGDVAMLSDVVLGKTVLEHVIANALYGDDLTKPVALIDYGPSNSHLELRRGLPYNHVMPDLNGRRHENYLMASRLAEAAGKRMPQLAQRAEQLQGVLKRSLWNEKTRWFDFQDDKGRKNTRYTVQMFKLFGSRVLDAEQEAGLLDHLNSPTEFVSQFGLHSLSKTDPAYDPADVDNGGPGACTCFPPQIAERLYKAGRPEAAENLFQRILWWGDRMPYWGDSIVADKIDYRKDTPLQCTIDGATVAQAIIFGMFGVRAEFNGDIVVDPHPPAFSPQMELRGLRIRGRVLDIIVNRSEYEVCQGPHRIRAPVGRPMLMQAARR